MKDQIRLQIRSRRNAASTPTSDINKTKKLAHATTAFRPYEEVHFKPSKVEKPVRKSGRIATKTLKQTVLDLKPIDKEEEKISLSKREGDNLPDRTKKKHKVNDEQRNKVTLQEKKLVQVKKTSVLEEKVIEIPKEEEELVAEKTQQTEMPQKEEEIITKEIEVQKKEIEIQEDKVDSQEILIEETKENTLQQVDTTALEQENTKKELTDSHQDFFEVDKEKSIESIEEIKDYNTPINSPSPVSSLMEPCTPPVESYNSAPYKTYVTEADKIRIEEEKLTLSKVRKALDIVITDRMARNKPTLYHQIEPVLRNSTRKSITISHVCKVMYIAPNLYTVEAKELRDFGGKVTEAFSVQFGKEWQLPLVGKDLQKRSEILENGLDDYFKTHKEPDATVPEIKLPRLSLVVDKKEWIDRANLPAGIKALLDTHKKISEAEEESKKPKPKPVGSVKDRMAALRARLAKKSSS